VNEKVLLAQNGREHGGADGRFPGKIAEAGFFDEAWGVK
jgi:hypothetical protein